MYSVRVIVTERGPEMLTWAGVARLNAGKTLTWQVPFLPKPTPITAQYHLEFEAEYGGAPVGASAPKDARNGEHRVPVEIWEAYRQREHPHWDAEADGLSKRFENYGQRVWTGLLPPDRLESISVTVRRLDVPGEPQSFSIPFAALPTEADLGGWTLRFDLPPMLAIALPPSIFR